MIYPVIPEQLEKHWDTVLCHIESCIARGILPVEAKDIKAAIADGRFKLFMLMDNGSCKGVCILNLREEFSVQYLNVYMMGYSPDYTCQDEDQLKLVEFGRKLGVKYITYFGRPGFQKLHKKHGWKPAQVLMVKEI